jgi:nucleolar protein 15
MGMRDKKRNQKRVLARRTAAPRSGEGKDFLVRGYALPYFGASGIPWESRARLTLVFLCCGLVQPLEDGSGKRTRKQLQQPEEPENTATVVYIGHIPHGFYEDQMKGVFPCDGDDAWIEFRDTKMHWIKTIVLMFFCCCRVL